ncbi:hypothetical protein [Phenylobacterium sp.]|uniref:hypothetical protein n=1 Tax=Phenylobacterium sp. TaxID=1871053 RepID=UPI0035B1781B
MRTYTVVIIRDDGRRITGTTWAADDEGAVLDARDMVSARYPSALLARGGEGAADMCWLGAWNLVDGHARWKTAQ